MKTFWPTFWATLAAILVAAAIIYGVTIKLIDWKLAKIKEGFSDWFSEKSHDDTPLFVSPSPSGTPDLAERIHRKLEGKLGGKHGIIIDSTPQPSTTPQP
jgi:hypothetical protein